jgi:hypothetical protein
LNSGAGPTGASDTPNSTGSDWRGTVFGRLTPSPIQQTPNPLRRPTALLAVAGLAFLVASQFVRWGWYMDVGGHVNEVGYVGQSEGGFPAAFAAAAMLLVIGSRSGAASGFRVVQYLPFVLGLTCLLLAASGYRQADAEMSSYSGDGRPGSLDAGVWLGLAGGVAVAIGGIAATLSRRGNAVHADAPAVSVRQLLPDLIVGAAGAPVALGLWLVFGQAGGMWLGIFGVFFGPVIALAAWRWLRGEANARNEPGPIPPVPMDRLHEKGPTR